MKLDDYFAHGFESFLILSVLIIVIYFIIFLSIEKKIKTFNARYPDRAVSVPFVSAAVRVAYFLIGFVIVGYQILPFRPAMEIILDASGVLAICITFAARESFSNYIAGFLLTIHKPFLIGDKISMQAPMRKAQPGFVSFFRKRLPSRPHMVPMQQVAMMHGSSGI